MPGDRFRECYNWDSYWIIRGLLASGLHAAAKQLLLNLLDLVDRYGFTPNGARAYYANRSQPPLLSAMVVAIWQATRDDALVAQAQPRLLKMHLYWTSGEKEVLVRGAAGGGGEGDVAGVADGRLHRLSRYHADLYTPRPESFREDAELATGAGLSVDAARQLFCDIASAAESGWDFSSRWFVGGDSLHHTKTTRVIPADLNAWLYRMELDIAQLAQHLGDADTHARYSALAAERLDSINALMWVERDGCWYDLLLDELGSDGSSGGGGGDCRGVAEQGTSARGGMLAHGSSVTAAGLDGCAGAHVAERVRHVSAGAGGATSGSLTDAQMQDADAAPGLRHAQTPTLPLPLPHDSQADAHATGTGPHQPAGGACLGQVVRSVHSRVGRIYASNWVPLWCGCARPGSRQAEAAVTSLQASTLLAPGGVLTSLYPTGQQWDAPNAWPPLVHMIVEGLAQSGTEAGAQLALGVAQRWVRANLAAYKATGHMHEKYNGLQPGAVGHGGEYQPQVGFGWSNGVLLDLLRQFGSRCAAAE